jgi:hypothetical protein
LITAITWARSHMLPWLTRASLIRHVEDDSGGLAGLEHENALSRAEETGKNHVQQETRGLQLSRNFERYHAKVVQEIVESCSYVRIARSVSEEGETPLIMAVLERHDSFGIVSCRRLKWLLVSHTDCPKTCEKKSQLTFRCQVNDYSSTDNVNHFDNLIGCQLCSLNEETWRHSQASPEKRRLNRSSCDLAYDIERSWKRWKMKM